MSESADVRDLRARKDLGTFNDSFTAAAPGHGVTCCIPLVHRIMAAALRDRNRL